MVCLEERGLTIDRLREVLRLEPETGGLYWKPRDLKSFKSVRAGKTWNARFAGTKAGHVDPVHGYMRCRIGGRDFWAHRLVFALVHGRFPNGDIDHINGVQLDNRPENLREVSHSENLKNSARPSNNTSGVLGVGWYKASGKWQAYIRAHGKQVHLGLFSDFDEAVRARKVAEVEFGYHENHGREKVCN